MLLMAIASTAAHIARLVPFITFPFFGNRRDRVLLDRRTAGAAAQAHYLAVGERDDARSHGGSAFFPRRVPFDLHLLADEVLGFPPFPLGVDGPGPGGDAPAYGLPR